MNIVLFVCCFFTDQTKQCLDHRNTLILKGFLVLKVPVYGARGACLWDVTYPFMGREVPVSGGA
ncbi:TPA: hypothetical protein ACRM4D_006888, partial [Pseudomonas aeruginosa]